MFLITLGTFSLSTLAGCTGGEGENGSGTTPIDTATPSPSPTPTTPNQQAVEHYNTGIDALLRNKEKLDEWAKSSFESSLVGTLQDRVSKARAELQSAEAKADPDGSLLVAIGQARLVADFQELSLAYYEGVDVLFQVISEAKSFGDEELHQRAADTFSEAKGVTEDLRTVIDDMGTVLEQINNDALDEPDLEYSGEPLDHLDLTERGAIDGVERYLVGYENIHLTFVQLELGQAHYENEAFTDARKDWETGLERAQQSNSAFATAIDNDYLPQNLNQESIKLLGMTETIIEAFDKFVEGATEAEAGNTEKADNLIYEGFDILGQM